MTCVVRRTDNATVLTAEFMEANYAAPIADTLQAISKMKHGSTHKTTKGYPRATAGPLRNQYIHRIVAAAMIGRALERDEEVHHHDQDRRNFWFTNLYILGNEDHGWVSAKQAWYMRERDKQLKAEWDAFMAQQQAKQTAEIAAAKKQGKPWQGQPDGALQEAWEKRNDRSAEARAV